MLAAQVMADVMHVPPTVRVVPTIRPTPGLSAVSVMHVMLSTRMMANVTHVLETVLSVPTTLLTLRLTAMLIAVILSMPRMMLMTVRPAQPTAWNVHMSQQQAGLNVPQECARLHTA